MKVTVLGTGAYGIALALMFYENKCDITMWTKFSEEKAMIEQEHENKLVLPKVKIPSNIEITTNMAEAIKDSKVILIAVPAHAVDNIVHELKKHYQAGQHIIIASKGIENDTCLFPYDIVINNIKTKHIAVISGPSFAVDIAAKAPIGLSLATKSVETERIAKETLQNEYLKLRTTDDFLGVSICGSIKNVIAVASGMLSGMGLPESTRAMLITESLHDIKELIHALGGQKKTILSFAGFGDLLLTCTSTKSRNFRYGYMVGSRLPKSEIDEYVNNTTIEGLYTLTSIYQLVKNKQVDMPIIDLIYDIIFHQADPALLTKFLISKV